MTRDLVETAKREGCPFMIRMADGREYKVGSPDEIHIGRAHVVFIDDRAIPHMLPLLTMTGISYLEKPSNDSNSK
jgi:hypothetical protein